MVGQPFGEQAVVRLSTLRRVESTEVMVLAAERDHGLTRGFVMAIGGHSCGMVRDPESHDPVDYRILQKAPGPHCPTTDRYPKSWIRPELASNRGDRI